MLLATLLLSAALVPQAPPAEETPPLPEAPAVPQEAEDPLGGFDASPPAMETTPVAPEAPPPTAPAPTTTPAAAMPASSAGYQADIDAGLRAFIRGRFSSAREAFERAYAANPQSAEAAFYLGYACYKLGEPSLGMNADKQRARDLFATAYRLDPVFQPVWGPKKSE